MKPTNKSPEIEELIDFLTGKNRQRKRFILEGNCMTCNNECIDDNFRDDASEREYQISGMCQECQDNAFGEPE